MKVQERAVNIQHGRWWVATCIAAGCLGTHLELASQGSGCCALLVKRQPCRSRCCLRISKPRSSSLSVCHCSSLQLSRAGSSCSKLRC